MTIAIIRISPGASGCSGSPIRRGDYLIEAMRDCNSGARTVYGNAAMAEVVAGLGDPDVQHPAHLSAGK